MPDADTADSVPRRYASVAADATVFRLVASGGGHLPLGHTVPDPGWLTPTQDDKAEAERSGREPGLSAWVDGRTTPAQARRIRDVAPSSDDAPAYEAAVADLYAEASAVASACDQALALAVVHDPDGAPARSPGWTGHALIEGLAPPKGTAKAPYRALRTRLVACFALRDD